jgi:hypothetical protein
MPLGTRPPRHGPVPCGGLPMSTPVPLRMWLSAEPSAPSDARASRRGRTSPCVCVPRCALLQVPSKYEPAYFETNVLQAALATHSSCKRVPPAASHEHAATKAGMGRGASSSSTCSTKMWWWCVRASHEPIAAGALHRTTAHYRSVQPTIAYAGAAMRYRPRCCSIQRSS